MIYNTERKPINKLLISNDGLYTYFIDSYERIVTIRQDRTPQSYTITQDNIYVQGSNDSVTITADK